MDVFKAWPGRAESIVISQESYMRCTGGVAPWRRDGDKGLLDIARETLQSDAGIPADQ